MSKFYLAISILLAFTAAAQASEQRVYMANQELGAYLDGPFAPPAVDRLLDVMHELEGRASDGDPHAAFGLAYLLSRCKNVSSIGAQATGAAAELADELTAFCSGVDLDFARESMMWADQAANQGHILAGNHYFRTGLSLFNEAALVDPEGTDEWRAKTDEYLARGRSVGNRASFENSAMAYGIGVIGEPNPVKALANLLAIESLDPNFHAMTQLESWNYTYEFSLDEIAAAQEQAAAYVSDCCE